MNEKGGLRFDHVAIPIGDLDASLNFYGEVLGLPLVEAMSGADWGGRAWLIVCFELGDGRQIALTAFKPGAGRAEANIDGPPEDARHYALGADELAPWRNRLRRAGLSPREEDHGDRQSLFVEDPNGVTWEITSPAASSLCRGAPDAAAAAIINAWRNS